jgi:hypothetical protein
VFGRSAGSLRTMLAAAIAVSALVVFVPSAGASINNGGFETGNFQGWSITNLGEGDWYVYSGTTAPLGGPIFAPPKGTFAATTAAPDPGTHVLYRQLDLGSSQDMLLSFFLYYANFGLDFCNASDLNYLALCNQQYRADILKFGADPLSVAPSDIVKPLFRTLPGDPASMAPTKLKFSLEGIHGKVILRFAEVDNQAPLNASVDKVQLKALS